MTMSSRRIGRIVERAMRSTLRSYSTDSAFAGTVAGQLCADPAFVQQVAEAMVSHEDLGERAALAIEVELQRSIREAGPITPADVVVDPMEVAREAETEARSLVARADAAAMVLEAEAPARRPRAHSRPRKAPVDMAPEPVAVECQSGPLLSYGVNPPAPRSAEAQQAITSLVQTVAQQVASGELPRASYVIKADSSDPDPNDPVHQRDFDEARQMVKRGAGARKLVDYFGWTLSFSQRFCERERKKA